MTCEIWQEAVDKAQESGLTLSPDCLLEGLCADGCVVSIEPIKKVKKMQDVKDPQTPYYDKPDHHQRSLANKGK